MKYTQCFVLFSYTTILSVPGIFVSSIYPYTSRLHHWYRDIQAAEPIDRMSSSWRLQIPNLSGRWQAQRISLTWWALSGKVPGFLDPNWWWFGMRLGCFSQRCQTASAKYVVNIASHTLYHCRFIFLVGTNSSHSARTMAVENVSCHSSEAVLRKNTRLKIGPCVPGWDVNTRRCAVLCGCRLVLWFHAGLDLLSESFRKSKWSYGWVQACTASNHLGYG